MVLASAMLRPMSWPGRARGRLAALLTVLVLAACAPAVPSPSASAAPSAASSTAAPPASASPSTPAAPTVRPARWTDCGGGFGCAEIRVPRDYAAPTEGYLNISHHPGRGDEAGQADRLAAGQSRRTRRIGRRVRPRRADDLPEGAPRAVRHRRLRSARGQLEHGDPLHRQPRRSRRPRPVAGRRGRARGAGRFGARVRGRVRQPQRHDPGRTCRPTRSRATST